MPSLPGRLSHAGHVYCSSAERCCSGASQDGSAAISDAALRELCSAFVASVYVVRARSDQPELFSPPRGPGLCGSDLPSLRAQKDACLASLERKRGCAITATETARLVAHLSPQPANVVLLESGCDSDKLQQPRHVVTMGPGLGLRVLTVGYIGKQKSGVTSGGAPHMLTVASADLQDAARWRSDNLPGATMLAYNVRRAQHRDVARELHHHLLPALQRSLSEAEAAGTALDLDEVVLQRV